MLKISHISKTFFRGTPNEKKALIDLSLTLNDGDFCTVIGGNGAGKSTLLNAVSGVHIPDEGTIELNGADVTRMSEFRRAKFIGRVFQDPMKGTAGGMQLEENLLLASRRGESRRLKWALDPKTADKVLKITDEIVSEQHLTTLMITHNMRDALRYGNRLIMMNSGRIIADYAEEEKRELTIEVLLKKFEENADALSDKIILG